MRVSGGGVEGDTQKSAFNKPSGNFCAHSRLSSMGIKNHRVSVQGLHQPPSAHRSSCFISGPPPPVCCLLYYFGANLDTLSFPPQGMLCLPFGDKDFFKKYLNDNHYVSITLGGSNMHSHLRCCPRRSAGSGRWVRGCPRYCRHLPKSC